jgi:hypothetical protein
MHNSLTDNRNVSYKEGGELMQWRNDAKYFNPLRAVEERYVFRGDRSEIMQFLERYPFLVSLLTEAYSNIVKYFPNPSIFLSVATDPEEFGADQLVASIATNMGPDEATDALSTFDKQWWLNALNWAQDKLCITVEFS